MTNSGNSLYKDIEPYDRGLLDVGEGNAIYWECSGNPQGRPAVYIHGGPASGSMPWARRFFDPEAYRIVLFDQRGCGRSRPLLTHRSQLEMNTTPHLICDLEALRRHLEVDRWVILGASWGSTLTLAYAQAYPDRVAAIVLAGVTTTSRREVEWLTHDVGRIFPQQWERLVSHIPAHMKRLRVVDAYASLLFDDDPLVCSAAAVEWCAWEDAHVSLVPNHRPNRRFEDPDFRLRLARMVTHYWRHAGFLEEGALLRNAGSLNSIPGVLLHGRYDVSSPLVTAWELQKRWSTSSLAVVDDAGHVDGSLPQRIVAALNRFRIISD